MAKKRSAATRRAQAEAAAARAAELRKAQQRKENRRRALLVGGAVVALLALVLVLGYLFQSSRDSTGASATPPAGAVGTYALAVGEASAPVRVDVYEDFLCPFCGQLEEETGAWLQEYAAQGKVQVRYHAVSILDPKSSTDYSTRAANALGVVLDAAGPEVATTFHDSLFADQPAEGSAGLDDDELVDLAVQAGATESAVRPGIEGLAFEQWVENGTDAASKVEGYQGTPLVLLDGEPLEGDITEMATALRDGIDAKQG